MGIDSVIEKNWLSFIILSIAILATFYGLCYNKSIKFDDKSIQYILPLLLFVIITITSLLANASGDKEKRPPEEIHLWIPFLSSFAILGLSSWTVYSVYTTN